jgi:hypothetical protein
MELKNYAIWMASDGIIFCTKLCGDQSAGSEVEMETHVQYGDLIRLIF